MARVDLHFHLGGAGSRVVKSQEVPGSNPGDAESVGSDGMIVNIYLYELILCLVCVRIRCFGLY